MSMFKLVSKGFANLSMLFEISGSFDIGLQASCIRLSGVMTSSRMYRVCKLSISLVHHSLLSKGQTSRNLSQRFMQ